MADIRVPTLGESVTEATVGKWFKQPGDAVAVDEPLVELETDKVTLEVPAPAAGVLSDIAAKDGATVGVGALLGQIKEGAGAPAKAAAPAAKPAPAVRPPSVDSPVGLPAASAMPRAAGSPAASSMPMPPSVRKMSAESGMDAGRVAGTGMHGQVTKGDIMAAIERAAALGPIGLVPAHTPDDVLRAVAPASLAPLDHISRPSRASRTSLPLAGRRSEMSGVWAIGAGGPMALSAIHWSRSSDLMR